MTIFDASTWIGPWPFSFAPAYTARTLRAHLECHGIGRALVSPLDAVFQPEPGPANRALLRVTRGLSDLVPVPVINPALANWREELERCTSDVRVRAVRVLPNYHAYRVDDGIVAAFAEALAARGVRLIVQMQLIDARHEYHAMNLKPVSVGELTDFLKRHRHLPVMSAGLLRPDILKLAPRFPNLLCDLSFAEWHDTLEHLTANVEARQLAFASHTPFLITAAALAKLAASTLRLPQKRAIAGGNLERFLAR